MKLQVAKWGDGLVGHPPPVAYAKSAGIAEGDALEATVLESGEPRLLPKRGSGPEAAWEAAEALAAIMPHTDSVMEALRTEKSARI